MAHIWARLSPIFISHLYFKSYLSENLLFT
nr:MAG TPA: hypothetical protein [Caudoviricetes sp.]